MYFMYAVYTSILTDVVFSLQLLNAVTSAPLEEPHLIQENFLNPDLGVEQLSMIHLVVQKPTGPGRYKQGPVITANLR